MERRDIIKDQIEQAGKAIGKLVSLLLGADNNEAIIEIFDQQILQLNEDLGISFEQLLKMDKEAITMELSESKGYNTFNLESFSNSIHKRYLLGKQKELDFINLAYHLLKIADDRSDVYSLERAQKLKQLNQELSNNGI